MYCFYDKNQGCDAINISPGEYFISPKGLVIHTLISSCISVALFDPLLKIGGMNHFIIPDKKKSANINTEDYGANSLQAFIDDFLKYGSLKSNLQAKLLGGSIFSEADNAAVSRTLRFTEEYLADEQIEIRSKSTGGSEIRKVYYFTDSFRILIGKLKYPDSELEKQMTDYHNRLSKSGAWA